MRWSNIAKFAIRDAMVSRVILTLGIDLFALIPCQVALAQRLPTDTELHALYCLPMVKFDLALTEEGIRRLDELLRSEDQIALMKKKDPAAPRKIKDSLRKLHRHVAEQTSVQRRLEAFIVPRIYDIDATSILASLARADEDTAQLRTLADQCNEQCAADSSSECVVACTAKEGTAIRARLDQCRNPTWLPF